MAQDKLPGDPSLPSTTIELDELIKAEKGNYKYSVEDFFKNPLETAYQLSPDGEYFSYMGPYERRKNIFIKKVGSEESLRITNELERDISGYFWANENRLIYIKDSGGDENFQLFGVNKDGTEEKELTPFDDVRIEIIDPLEDQPNEMIIGMNKNNPMLFEPYRLDINTGEYTQLAENNNPVEPIAGWMTDHAGRLRIAIKVTDGTNTTIMYRSSENDAFKDVISTDFKVSINPIFFDFDNGDIVYASSNFGRDKSAIVKIDLSTGKEVGEVICEHPSVDIANLLYSKKRKVITAASYTTWKRHYMFFDATRNKLQEIWEEKIGADKEVVAVSTNKAENKWLLRTYSDRSLGSYFFYDADKNTLQKIADVSPWIDENDMAKMLPIEYQARDGKLIHGYLTLPTKSTGRKLPLIVNPHGGPWARDDWGWNPECQLFASRGYAVLQMNFRGSVGYGRDFWESSFKQWGQSMQDDITDGVHWAIEEGYADSDNIAIYGGSYGGYATLAGVTFTPELYKCAIDYVGVSNLFTFMKTIPPYWKPYLEMMHEMVGDPTADQIMMEKASPAMHVDKINSPLFVIQGANDPRVNIDESDQIVRSLRGRGVDVPYMVKYNEGHGFHNEENRFEGYKAMIGFLAKHMRTAL